MTRLSGPHGPADAVRRGGGCACKIPPGELEDAGRAGSALPGGAGPARRRSTTATTRAVVRVAGGLAVVSTADFFTPVVDDAYDWGRIAAANALSDVYAMGGEPGGRGQPGRLAAVGAAAGAAARGAARRRSTWPAWPAARSPAATASTTRSRKYGMAVTGVADPDRLLRNDAAPPGLPLSLTKPLGVGRAQQPAQGDRRGVPAGGRRRWSRSTRRRRARRWPPASRAATDVTGFGLLGHLLQAGCAPRAWAPWSTRPRCRYLDGAREALRDGYVSGGTRRNLDWVRPHLDVGAGVGEDELLLLADAQTSGGLLVVGEVPGGAVIGETVAGPARIEIR